MYYKIFAITIMLSCLALNAQESNSFSLYEAQSYALENSEKYKREELEIDISKKQIVETRSIGLPQVNSEVNFQNFLNIPVQALPASFVDPTAGEDEFTSVRFGTDYNASLGLTVNQLIFDGSYIVGLRVSNYYKSFVEESLTKTKQEILFDVTQAYELTIVSNENKLFLDSLVKSTEKLLLQQEKLFESGMITEEDVDQTKYSLLQAKTNLSAANFSHENALALLKMHMAYPLEREIILEDDLQSIMKNVISTDMDGSIEENIDLELLRRRKRLSEFDLQNMRMNNLPRLGAFVNHGYNYFANDPNLNLFEFDQWFDQTVIGVNLSIPIFASGERWAKSQKAKIAIKQDEYAIQELERALQMQEVQYKNDFKAALEQLEMQEENIRLAQKIYNNAVNKSEIGRENPIMVTQKYNQLIAAQSQYINAMIDIFNARLNLDQLYNKINK